MAKQVVRTFALFIVSVDFDTKRRPKPPYYQLKVLLPKLGGVLKPTHQISLLLTPLTAAHIRTRITRGILKTGDRVYVGKIAKGSAWSSNLLKTSSADLKAVLRTWAQGADPDQADIRAAKAALKNLLPLRR